MVARETDRLAFLLALQPGLISPTLAAQMAATSPSTPRTPAHQRRHRQETSQLAYGDSLDKAGRYARTDEFSTS